MDYTGTENSSASDTATNLGHHSNYVGWRSGGGGRRAAHRGGWDPGRFGQRYPPCCHHCLGVLRGGHLGHLGTTRGHCDGLLGKEETIKKIKSHDCSWFVM